MKKFVLVIPLLFILASCGKKITREDKVNFVKVSINNLKSMFDVMENVQDNFEPQMDKVDTLPEKKLDKPSLDKLRSEYNEGTEKLNVLIDFIEKMEPVEKNLKLKEKCISTANQIKVLYECVFGKILLMLENGENKTDMMFSSGDKDWGICEKDEAEMDDQVKTYFDLCEDFMDKEGILPSEVK